MISKFSNVLDGLTHIHSMRWRHSIWKELLLDLRIAQEVEGEKLRLGAWLAMAVDLTVTGFMVAMATYLVVLRDGISADLIALSIFTGTRLQQAVLKIMQLLLALENTKESLSRAQYFHSNSKSEVVRGAVYLPERWGEGKSIEFHEVVIGDHAYVNYTFYFREKFRANLIKTYHRYCHTWSVCHHSGTQWKVSSRAVANPSDDTNCV